MIIYDFSDGTSNSAFWDWYNRTDNSVFYGESYDLDYLNPGAPPSTPEEFIYRKRQEIAKTQMRQRNERIKPWEDKRKRFR